MEVNAENKKRKEQIVSTGNFKFENGNVYITASDFLYLADEIDRLESTYKCNLIDALNNIGTYFKADGSITYDSSKNEIHSEEAKTSISFGNIKQGILSSQSIESLLQTQAVNKDGNLLYYSDKEGQENKNIYGITTADTGYPMFYQSANADNLSAGTAAWVNGVLIKGNGTDNAIYREEGYEQGHEEGYGQGHEEGYVKGYEQGKGEGYGQGHGEGYQQGYEQGKGEGYEQGHGEGYGKGYGEGHGKGYEEGKGKGYEEGYGKGHEEGYREGYTQGIADGLSKVNVQYTYHTHAGNASVVGGCYGYCTGYTPVYCNCWGWVGGSYGCDNCHHAVGMHGDGFCTGIVSNEAYTYIGLVCGKTTDTIESATIVY